VSVAANTKTGVNRCKVRQFVAGCDPSRAGQLAVLQMAKLRQERCGCPISYGRLSSDGFGRRINRRSRRLFACCSLSHSPGIPSLMDRKGIDHD
jgi:hypothetical protein